MINQVRTSMSHSLSGKRFNMVKATCSVPNCQFERADVSEALAIALLANHGLAHQNSTIATLSILISLWCWVLGELYIVRLPSLTWGYYDYYVHFFNILGFLWTHLNLDIKRQYCFVLLCFFNALLSKKYTWLTIIESAFHLLLNRGHTRCHIVFDHLIATDYSRHISLQIVFRLFFLHSLSHYGGRGRRRDGGSFCALFW